jgi:hypothetical protein
VENQTVFADPANQVEQANLTKLIWDMNNVEFYESTLDKVHTAITSILEDTTTKMDIPPSYVGKLQQIKSLGLTLFTGRPSQNNLKQFLEFTHLATKE